MNPRSLHPPFLAWSLLFFSPLSLAPIGAQTGSPSAAAVYRFESLEKSGLLTSPPSGTDQAPVKPDVRLASVRVDDGATVESLLHQQGMANSPQNVALFQELNPDLQSDRLPAGKVITMPEVVGPPSLMKSIAQGEKLDFMLNSETKQAYLQMAANLDKTSDPGARFHPYFTQFSKTIQDPNQVISAELIESMSSNAELALLLAEQKETIDPEVWRESAAALEQDLKLRADDLKAIQSEWSRLSTEKPLWRSISYGKSQSQLRLPIQVSVSSTQGQKPVSGLTVRYVMKGWYDLLKHHDPKTQQQAKNNVKRFADPSSPCTTNILQGNYMFWAEDPATGRIVTNVLEANPANEGNVPLRT